MFSLCTFVVIFLFSYASAEPSCSKYHYEEQILERVIKSEFYMQDFQKQFERLLDKVTSEVTSLKDDMSLMQRDWIAFKEQTTQSVSVAIAGMDDREKELEGKVNSGLKSLESTKQNVTQDMLTIKETMITAHVSFRARAPADMAPSVGDTIIYQTAEENLGGGYDTSTGVFKAPVPGVYIFSVNICSQNADHLDIILMSNGHKIVGTRLTDATYYYCATLLGHTILEKGDLVWVQCFNGGKMYDAYGYYWNAFSGLLVHM